MSQRGHSQPREHAALYSYACGGAAESGTCMGGGLAGCLSAVSVLGAKFSLLVFPPGVSN